MTARPPCVLIVEDDPDIREMERLVFESRGYEVLTAANGYDALRVLESARPCVVVLDLMMPVMDGLMFLETRLHWGSRSRAIPIICVSAAGPNLTAEALRRGAISCLSKPTDLDELTALVEAQCHRSDRCSGPHES